MIGIAISYKMKKYTEEYCVRIDTAFKRQADELYRQAEDYADEYFQALLEEKERMTYYEFLMDQIEAWGRKHKNPRGVGTFLYGKKASPAPSNYIAYLHWLDRRGKLEDYLVRSVSYIYMRDLGKDLSQSKVQESVQRTVCQLKEKITSQQKDIPDLEIVNLSWLYRKAQESGVESTFLWLLGKLKMVAAHIPPEMNTDQSQRKLIKIIVGVLMYELEDINEHTPVDERTRRIDQAIRLGYAYGLTYPFIDDLLDARILSSDDAKRYSDFIRKTLLTGVIPPLENVWEAKNIHLITFIHMELSEAFLYIQAHQNSSSVKQFHRYAYIFFQSQEADRNKSLSYAHYTNAEVYVPVILKAAFSRLMVRSILRINQDDGAEKRIFYYGLYNQLADDFTDIFEDMENQVVTPYTYYLTYHKERPDIINPFQFYWIVIAYFIREVVGQDAATTEVILSRAIHGLKRLRQRVGIEKYQEIMQGLSFGNDSFDALIQGWVEQATDVDFLDKLLRDRILAELKKEREEQEWFAEIIAKRRIKLNQILESSFGQEEQLSNENLIDAANYSLSSDGKRIRPVMAWVMGVEEYGLKESEIFPVLKSIEWMHTGSLILDDLPSQDNAGIRRGRVTLHEIYSVATAELTSMFLIQKAIEEETKLEEFDAKIALKIIRYTSQRAADMCRGQAMDLNSKGKSLSLAALNTMCFYKTGIAFEVSLVIPAILANQDAVEINRLKRFSKHAGIAFQIKDDLLDAEGDAALLGKSTDQDAKNGRSTFVTILGVEGARKEMWEHYCLAMECLQEKVWKTTFLKHLLNYIVNREK